MRYFIDRTPGNYRRHNDIPYFFHISQNT